MYLSRLGRVLTFFFVSAFIGFSDSIVDAFASFTINSNGYAFLFMFHPVFAYENLRHFVCSAVLSGSGYVGNSIMA